jgi:hypothetical protein
VKWPSMVSASTPQRILFCMVAAVVAAAFADPLVELASNAGVFGSGNFTDHSNLDVLPALGVGLLLGIALLAAGVRKLLTRGAVASPATRLGASHDRPRPGLLAQLVPAIFATQIAALYAMETAEQFVVAGHALGGTIWLGGPVPVSLAVHALIGIIATFVIGRTLVPFTRTAARIVVFLRGSTTVAARGPRRAFAQFRHPANFRRSTPLVCRIGERAPPLLTA